eukprot:s1991_g4.t1
MAAGDSHLALLESHVQNCCVTENCGLFGSGSQVVLNWQILTPTLIYTWSTGWYLYISPKPPLPRVAMRFPVQWKRRHCDRHRSAATIDSDIHRQASTSFEFLSENLW